MPWGNHMTRVRKAVITAAGRGTRMYPATTTIQKEMLPLMDRDGITKPAIQLIIEEALDSGTDRRCARQIIDVFEKYGASVSAVQQTPSELLHLFGTVRGKLIQESPRVYDIDHIYEKPPVEYAEQNLRVEGLLWGMYLCFFGMHIFTPTIFDSLQYAIDHDLREKGEFQLTSAQERLRASGERYLAFEAVGDRHDI